MENLSARRMDTVRPSKRKSGQKKCHHKMSSMLIYLFLFDYNVVIISVTKKPSLKTISTAILAIEKVSAQDFQTEFKCSVEGFYSANSTTLSLKRRGQCLDKRLVFICGTR